VVDAVAKMEQPACHAGLDRVQCIAGRTELETVSASPLI